jgi:hypothetical protein
VSARFDADRIVILDPNRVSEGVAGVIHPIYDQGL